MKTQRFILTFCLSVCAVNLPAQTDTTHWVTVEEMKQTFLDHLETAGETFTELANRVTRTLNDGRFYLVQATPGPVTKALEQLKEGHYTGQLDGLYYPRYYKGNWVSAKRVSIAFKNGIPDRYTPAQAKSPCKNQADDFGHYIDENGQYITIGLLGDDWETYPTKTRNGFSHMINDIWRDMGFRKLKGNRPAFSILVYTDRDGNSDMEVMLPRQLNAANQVVTDALRQCIRQLPKGGMGYLWRTDGSVFPGRYIKAVLYDNGRWSFGEYAFSKTIPTKD